VETRFTYTLDPESASRQVFWFHRPETLGRWLEEGERNPDAPTLRHRLRALPQLEESGLWGSQYRAIGFEPSLSANRPRAPVGRTAVVAAGVALFGSGMGEALAPAITARVL
jgi:type I restriction enzyme R subunit